MFCRKPVCRDTGRVRCRADGVENVRGDRLYSLNKITKRSYRFSLFTDLIRM